MEKITVKNPEYFDLSLEIYIDKPNICPYCKWGTDSKIEAISEPFKQADGKITFAVLFRCTVCGKYFFRAYIDNGTNVAVSLDYQPTSLTISVPEEVKKISPKFADIYTQALTAEAHGLSDVTGMALRKSIEFLVKDYLINYKKLDSIAIKKDPLARAISKIENPRIKNLAKVSTWLGNDETHYEKVWKSKDVSHMKLFISALIYFISLELVSDEAEEMIASSNSK